MNYSSTPVFAEPTPWLHSVDPTKPVKVNCVDIKISTLSAPLKKLVTSLPVGTGFKGGIARQVLRQYVTLVKKGEDLSARSDFKKDDGSYDCDILVAVKTITGELRLKIRQHFAGQKIGKYVIDPKDIEVTCCMQSYFRTRDVTLNECLLFIEEKGSSVVKLYYTDESFDDISNGDIRPSIHCFQTVFKKVWQWCPISGKIIASPSVISRCLIRWLKGHGVRYSISHETWQTYAYDGVNPFSLLDTWRVLKSFPANDAYGRAFVHLKALRLIDPSYTPETLWASMLSFMATWVAKYGRRFTMAEPSAIEIEEWITAKEKIYEENKIVRLTSVAIGTAVEPDTEAEVILPGNLKNFPVLFDLP